MTMNPDTLRKREDGFDLMIMSVYKPDNELRQQAVDMDCLPELLEIREQMLNYLYELRKDWIKK